MFTFFQDAVSSGNSNLCYLNFFCANSLGWLDDFNHVLSSMTYAVFGISYNYIVYHRERIHKAAVVLNRRVDYVSLL